MPPDSAASTGYFDTPARAERLQLLAHLLRNVGEVIYLRGPAGAGKTLFAHTLLDELGDEMATVWLRGGQDTDYGAAAVSQLGLPPAAATPWPDGLLAALAGRPLLVVVDDADQLSPDAVERLAVLHAAGGRLLLLGRGGLAPTGRDWDVQFVDLPPFNAAQSGSFLRSRAGEQAEKVSDETAAVLHRAAQGMPGPLLEGLDAVLTGGSHRPAAAAVQPAAEGRIPGGLGRWLVGGLVVAVLAALLVNQERINRMLEPPSDEARPLAEAAPRPGDAPQDLASMPPLGDDPGPAPVDEQAAGIPEAVGLGPVPADLASDAPTLAPAGPGAAAQPPPSLAERTAAEDLTAPDEDAPAVDEDPLEAVLRDALAAAADASDGAAEPDPGPASPGPAAEAANAGRGLQTMAPQPPADDPPAPVEEPAAGVRLGPQPSTVDQPSGVPVAPGVAPAAVEERVGAPPTPAVAPVPAVAGAGTPTPAPVEERSSRAPGAAAAQVSARAPAEPGARTATVQGPRSEGSGLAWLKGRSPGRYTLQLVGSRDRAAIERYVRVHKIAPPYAVFERQLDGRPWYSLVAGDYPDRAAAVAARERLPPALTRADVWPRSFESIQKSL
jgi:type II secretory pathway predicted ATPase ExeA